MIKQQNKFKIDYTDQRTMQAMKTGRRLRYFRKRAGLSQFDVELEIGAASGSISRIENGVTNANKETLNAIADVLEMSLLEREYTYGKRMDPPSEEDVTKAVESVRELFNKPWVFGYMIDDRYRVWKASNLFIKLSGVSKKEYENVYGRSLLDIALDPEWGGKFVDKNTYEETIKHLLDLYYSECGYMVDDPIYLDTIEKIKKVKFAWNYWNKIIKSKPLDFNHHDNRTVKFNFHGIKVPIKFSTIPFYKDERFMVIEYILTSKL
ncbi:MAG: hypothetical protein KatS3mg085_101 [Candidatus Dojkabacteria bacterium]|nr:MAG: hypothetical protein KatS3mg085_101 [Candidatus Dojkabacteria bacterium]